jgi:MFS family permease
MSMYPSPYHPPGVQQYYAAPIDPLRHARRASIFMFIMGPLIFLTGTCMASVLPIIRMAPPSPDTDRLLQTASEQTHGHPEIFTATGVLLLLLGSGMLVLAFFVRRGGRRSCTVGAVVMGLLAVYFLLNLLSSVVMGNIFAVVFSLLMIALFSMTLIWLIQAIRAAGTIQLAQQQYAAQYWHYQQTMQAHANAGYGYGQPPQASPPSPAVQQPPQNPNAG